jgi:sterol desaturase/sphingolipid hydroxylase (fatty acid hydroxylase superfamily)
MHMTTRLPRLVFPLLLIAPSAAVGVLASLGLAPPVALTAVVLTLIAVLTALEHWRPFRREWQAQPRGETATDVVYIALASVPDRLTRLIVEVGAITWLGALALQPGVSRSWLHDLALAGLAFIAADLGKYLIHRASHSVDGLWRFHLAHHQPGRLSALNALRLHPVNMAYNAAIDTLPLVLLGVTPMLAAVLAALRATVGIVQHANLELEDGRQWLFNAPSYHRTHHDVDVGQANHNYASTLLVWDRLLGTLLRASAPRVVGIAPLSHRLPLGYLGQLLYPFCREKLDTCRWAPYRSLLR